MFPLLNRKEDCVVKIKISLFIITKENVSLISCRYVIVNLTLPINANEGNIYLLNINNFKQPKAKS